MTKAKGREGKERARNGKEKTKGSGEERKLACWVLVFISNERIAMFSDVN